MACNSGGIMHREVSVDDGMVLMVKSHYLAERPLRLFTAGDVTLMSKSHNTIESVRDESDTQSSSN